MPSGKPFYLRSNKRKELQGNRQTLAWKANLETEIALADMLVGAAAKPAQCWRVISSALSCGSRPIQTKMRIVTSSAVLRGANLPPEAPKLLDASPSSAVGLNLEARTARSTLQEAILCGTSPMVGSTCGTEL